MSDLEQLEDWVGGLIAALEPRARRKLALAVARDLKQSQVRRIAAQQNPDGSGFEPRKKQAGRLRSQSGRIRRSGGMFQKLRKAAYLGHEATAEEASVGFNNATVARVARVHQDGLVDRVSRAKNAPSIRYPSRRLLGFTDDDRQRLLATVLMHLEANQS